MSYPRVATLHRRSLGSRLAGRLLLGRLHPGEVVALVGESGSGKSMVGRLIMRLLEPTSGTVSLAGIDVGSMSRRALRPHRRTVSIVFPIPPVRWTPG